MNTGNTETKPQHLVEDFTTGEVIELAWADEVSFDAIEAQTGLSEAQVIKLMRQNLRPGSFRTWRARVSGRPTKHAGNKARGG